MKEEPREERLVCSDTSAELCYNHDGGFLCFQDNGRRVTCDSQLQEWDTVAERLVDGVRTEADSEFISEKCDAALIFHPFFALKEKLKAELFVLFCTT